MKVSEFDYALPPEAIAQHPLPDRDASRLMILDRSLPAGAPGALRHARFRDLTGELRRGDLLVVNRSAVIPARLLGRTRGGGSAEILLLRATADAAVWEALVRPGRRLRPGSEVVVGAGDLVVRIESEALAQDGRRRVRLFPAQGTLQDAVARHGRPPLPPYIRREAVPEDRERYQTVYAREEGSVAAPTAGLHFTAGLLAALASRGVEHAEVVLHVGPGTFLPVKAERVEDHRVAPEPFAAPEEAEQAIRRARARGGRVVAVGTTSVRVLETLAEERGEIRAAHGETDLVIAPGHRFRCVDALVTNFHLPRSSLLLLVCAFAGRDRVLAAYGEALRTGYRFYSYGDAMLIV
jgi:S-adenosylmethionine:tRNA ribosyltransferase-isomerase